MRLFCVARWKRVLELTAQKASSNTKRGPEKPMTSMGCAARKQKMIPWILVEMRSSGTPIMLSTLSANDVNDKKKESVDLLQ